MRSSLVQKQNLSNEKDSQLDQQNASKSNNTSIIIPFTEKEDPEYVEFVKAVITKTKKQSQTSTILKYFLGLTSFVDFLNQLFPDSRLLLNSLLENIEYETQKRNHVLFRVDDIGEIFYIILKGSVKVLVIKQIKFLMTKREYLEHLIKLKVHDERLLIKKTLEDYGNSKFFQISELDFSTIKPMNKEKIAMKINENDPQNKGSTNKIVSKSIYDIVKTSISCMDKSMLQLRNDKSSSKFLLDNQLYRKVYAKCVEMERNNMNYLERFKIQQSSQEAKDKHQSSKLLSDNQKSIIGRCINQYPISCINTPSKTFENFDSEVKMLEEDCGKFNKRAANLPDIQEERFEFTIYEYSETNTLTKGMSFGNLALEDAQGRRTATVVCSEDCMFGALNKNIYTSSLMEASKRFTQHNITYFLRFNFFSDILYKVFERKIYQKMTYKRTSKGNHIMSQGSQVNHIYFLKSGEYVVGFRGSIQHAEKIIELLGGSRCASKDELFLLKNCPEFIKECNGIHYFNIKIIVEVGYLGFEEHVQNEISLFEVVCKSKVGEYFVIDRELFQNSSLFESPVLIQIESNSLKSKVQLIDSILAVVNSKLRIIMEKKMSKLNTNLGNLNKPKSDLFNNLQFYKVVMQENKEDASPPSYKPIKTQRNFHQNLASSKPNYNLTENNNSLSKVINNSSNPKGELVPNNNLAQKNKRNHENKLKAVNTSTLPNCIWKSNGSEDAESGTISKTVNSLQLHKPSGTYQDYYSLTSKIDTQSARFLSNNRLINLTSKLFRSNKRHKFETSKVERNIYNKITNNLPSLESSECTLKTNSISNEVKTKKLQKYKLEINNTMRGLCANQLLSTPLTQSSPMLVPLANIAKKKIDVKESLETNSTPKVKSMLKIPEECSRNNKVIIESKKLYSSSLSVAKHKNKFFMAHYIKQQHPK